MLRKRTLEMLIYYTNSKHIVSTNGCASHFTFRKFFVDLSSITCYYWFAVIRRFVYGHCIVGLFPW